MDTAELLVCALLFLFGAGLFPIINNAISATNMTAWTFAGHELAASILGVFGYVYLGIMIFVPSAIIVRRLSKE
jgi:hypothetical protein